MYHFSEALPLVQAGTQSSFYVVARDKFNNRVNPDDTVIQSLSVIIHQCGLKFPLHTQAGSPPLSHILTTPSEDCSCDAKHLGNGVFEVKYTPYCRGSGIIYVSVTGSDGTTFSSQLNDVHLEVKCDLPSAVHSRIQYNGTTVAVNKTYSLKLYLFDKYYNIVQPSKVDFRRLVHIDVLAGNTDVNFSIKKVDNYFVLRFVARRFHSSQRYHIVIAIDGMNVPQTPLVISVTNHHRTTSSNTVEWKLGTLYASLKCHRKSGLPTQTVERKDILNSALRILSGDKISYYLRVRFDDESGMDLGGLSK